jgi:hypothetical protein
MALLLPGERQPGRFWEVLLAMVVVLGLCALGCASSTPVQTRRLPASVFQAARLEARTYRPTAHRDEGAALVEQSLHRAGLRFGTDGTTGALWRYLSSAHRPLAPAQTRPGDVLFFETRAGWDPPDCERADHAGVVESVAADGRIGFWEARGGQVRRSFVDPRRPTLRRTEHGEIANSFLRAKSVDDEPSARYFAGEMLCGVVRVVKR